MVVAIPVRTLQAAHVITRDESIMTDSHSKTTVTLVDAVTGMLAVLKWRVTMTSLAAAQLSQGYIIVRPLVVQIMTVEEKKNVVATVVGKLVWIHKKTVRW